MGLEYMGEYYRNYAQVNLDHIRNNLELVRATIKKGCKLMVVLKANAYGHGIEQCALACRNADMFAVATLQEALMIRRTGLRTPVLLLGPVDPNEINTVCQNEFTLTISSVSYAEQIQRECERSGQSVLCHVKVDTGLNRTGIRCRTFSIENACEEAGRIFKMPSLKIEGVYTHFACAGSENLDDQAFTQTQYSTFVSFCERMEHLGFSLGLRHCCSTSAFLTHPEMELDMVRTGMTVLGQCISDEYRKRLGLLPAICWRARVLQIHDVPQGESVSYDRMYRTEKAIKIAVIAAGYADGYKQNYSNRSRILLNGVYAPVIGKICMDYFMADISNVPDVKEGDYAILLGVDGENEVSAMELGGVNQTAPGDVTCAISARVPRVYFPALLE